MKVYTLDEIFSIIRDATRYYGSDQVNSVAMDAIINGEQLPPLENMFPNQLTPN
jgi:hypothetical protein